MGDRTWVEFHVKESDKDNFLSKLKETYGWDPDRIDRNIHGGVVFLLYDVNYGGDELVEELAETFDFHGGHGDGGNYGAGVFIAKDGEIVWCPSTYDGGPCVQIGRDGTLDDNEFRVAKLFWKLFNELYPEEESEGNS